MGRYPSVVACSTNTLRCDPPHSVTTGKGCRAISSFGMRLVPARVQFKNTRATQSPVVFCVWHQFTASGRVPECATPTGV